jgi:uncharacterized membrane protein (DUF485 family)
MQEGRESRFDDPWHDIPATGWDELPEQPGTAAVAAAERVPAAVAEPGGPAGAVYREIHRSPAFREVRRRHRGFVVPAAVAFLVWYLAYVVAAVAAPGLMARQVVGPLNTAMVAGLAQFLTTFLLTWAYVRHARLYRDPAALDLRWTVYERSREPEPGATARVGASARTGGSAGTAGECPTADTVPLTRAPDTPSAPRVTAAPPSPPSPAVPSPAGAGTVRAAAGHPGATTAGESAGGYV